ncbi:MAG TPA: tetratricopeptide repeat protein [Polyangiaceae bacterium]|nr:tetratricopeptide repeat protein [Polyangiaceae bacterium]
MQQQPPRQRPGTPTLQATGPSLEARGTGEEQTLESMLASLARNVLPQGAWEKVYETARAEERLSELAFAFDAVAQGRRLKATHPAAAAEFLFQAGRLSEDLGKLDAAAAYFERALALAPGHAPSFARLEELLRSSEQHLKLAELYAATAQHRARAEQPGFLRQATELLLAAGGSDDRVVELLQQRLRLDPADDDARESLEPRLLKTGRFRDLIRLNEQALSGDLVAESQTRIKLLSSVVDLYANKLQEPERALPHVEQLLALEPTHDEARRVAHKLVGIKGLAARAASALAGAYEALGSPQEVAHFLTLELESTRGAKRAALLVRLGRLKEQMADPAGAFECFDSALAIDAGDDDLRSRYVALALQLQRQTDAARALTRLLANVKEPATRARLSVQLAEVLLRAGDIKRASSLAAEVMAAADAPVEAVLGAAYLLREIRSDDKDPRILCEILERIGRTEPDEPRRREVDEQLATLATRLKDVPRAIGAYERLLTTTARPKALEALASLYEATREPAKRAWLLEERAKDATDSEEARRLLLSAAETYARGANDPAAAIGACKTVIRLFGAAPDVLGLLVPLLESEGLWLELAEALSLAIAQSDVPERAVLLSRLGMIRLERLHDVDGAISALESALAIDANDEAARAALEALAATAEHRVAAARVLEPVYRRSGSRAALLRMLEIRAAHEPDIATRLAVLREAAEVATDTAGSEGATALEFVGRGLKEATSNAQPLGEWLERLGKARVEPARRAAILVDAMRDRAVESAELSALAKEAAEALVASGNLAPAIEMYRRALAYEPYSTDLLARIDELLRQQGDAVERVALCRAALERATEDRRRELLRRIGDIQRNDLRDFGAAITTFQTLLESDARDTAAHDVLEELYTSTGRWADLCELLEMQVAQRGGDAGRDLRVKLVQIAAEHGDGTRVKEHSARLLEDPGLEPIHLATVQAAADRVDAVELLRSVLSRRADAATDAGDAVAWLDRLATLELDRRNDPQAAAAAWKRAAQLAESALNDDAARSFYSRTRQLAPTDAEVMERLAALHERAGEWTELPALYLALEQQSESDDRRVEYALRAAQVLSQRLGDVHAAVRHAARAFELAPQRKDILLAFQDLGAKAGATDVFEQSVDNVLRRASSDATPIDADHRSLLMLARAQALASDPRSIDEAIGVYRKLVQDDGGSDSARAEALSALEALVAGDAGSPIRRADHEWLLEWRAEHAVGDDRIVRTLDWARAEETKFADPTRALVLYRRALALDPDSDDALAAVARLSLDAESTEEALAAMRTRRDRARGPTRGTIELQIARTLARTGRWDEALESLRLVLATAPTEWEGLALAADALMQPRVRDAAMQVLERACESADDAAARERILTYLIAIPLNPDGLARRSLWSERLCDLQREAGRYAEALTTASGAVRASPEIEGLWDRAVDVAREVEGGVDEVAALYEEVLRRPLSVELAGTLGQRAVRFCEEWFDDPSRLRAILDRVLLIDPDADWAFDRLKLLLDSTECWDDLFALYDRVLGSATGSRREALLEDAARTAKDFADRPDRATHYLEQLREIRPSDPKLSSALERLYERQRKHRELVTLLGARLPALEGDEARRARIRIATLWLDELDDPGAALDVVEPLLGDAAAAGGLTSSAWTLLERILESVSEPDARWSTLPPLEEADFGPKGKRAPRDSSHSAVRLRAAKWLRSYYAAAGREVDLARVLLVELETISRPDDRAARHVQIAELYERAGDLASAIDQTGCAVVLAPENEALRAKLAELADRMGRFERLADVLAGAAHSTADLALRATLAMQAAEVRAHRLSDTTGAIALLLPILFPPGGGARAANALVAARTVEPLLEAAGRLEEQLDVEELIASIEDDEVLRRDAIGRAARLAIELGHQGRAIASWELRLAADPRDQDALDGLVALLSVDGSNDRLARVLELRAMAATSPELRRVDLVRVAKLLGKTLGRPHDAIAAWIAIENEFGEADDAVSELATLLRETEQWGQLSQLLDRGALRASDLATRGAYLGELGDVLRERLGETDRAIGAYARTLEEEPTNARARSGLEALTDDPASAGSALQVLLAALRRCDDWGAILALTSKRVTLAASQADRVNILIEASELAEGRAGDARRAFDAMRQAFSIAPHDERVQRDVARLAEISDAWPALVDSYRRAVADLDDGALSAQIWSTIGATLEFRLHDLEGALESYLHVVSMSPDAPSACAAVRTAGSLGRWDQCARVVVDRTIVSSPFAGEVLDAFEGAAAEHDAWQAAAFALTNVARASGLRGLPARDVHARIALWHRDRRGDPDSAEESLQLALSEDPSNVGLLTALVESRRRRPDRLLVDTLISLSQATAGSLTLLREATELARDVVRDQSLTLELARSVLQLARQHWASGESTGDAAACAEWAVETIARLHDEAGDARSVVDTLAVDDGLPFDVELKRNLRRRAARVALDRLGDEERAVALYLSIFEEAPRDPEAVARLVSIYAKPERRPDLLRLRERQIEAAPDAAERIALRLEAARLLAELGDVDRAVATLHDSLSEQPRDAASVEYLATVLESASRFPELRDLLVEQAAQASDAKHACDLWARAARIATERLGDDAAAAAYHQKVVALEPRAESFAALALLAERSSEPLAAAGWLEKWLEVVPPEQYAEVALRLAEVLVAAGESKRAAHCLERAIAKTGDADRLRQRLATLYREAGQWLELACVVADSAERCPDSTARLERLLESAELFANRCGEPQRAVALLKEAIEIAPEDPSIQLTLADVLGKAGRYEEARAIVQSKIDAFGGRRPKERASIHRQMAQLELATGNRTRALVELDAAARIDPQNPEILQTLARLAQEDGQLERAEKSYRALLVVLRRRAEVSDQTVARSEVLLELSAIAARRGEQERAREILESALETAADSDFERARLEAALRARGDGETLVRVLEARLAVEPEGPGASKLLTELADVLSDRLGRRDDALRMRMRAIALDPRSQIAHDTALALARTTGRVDQYVEGVTAIVEKAVDAGDVALALALLLRLGAVAEADRGEAARAAAVYERALRLEPSSSDILAALDRVYERLGDIEGRARVLSSRIEIETRRGSTREASDALYRLAELRLASRETLGEGAERLKLALDLDPQLERAERALSAAVALDPQDTRILDVYERVGREPGHERALVDALRLRAMLPGASLARAREAVEAALRFGDRTLAESILVRFTDTEASGDRAAGPLAWALATLASLREQAGDLRGAVRLKARAAETADPSESRRLRLEVARIAANELGDLSLAAETYAALHRADPADREVWQALAEVHRRQDQPEKLATLLQSVIESIDDQAERARLRLERVRLMQRLGVGDLQAAPLLREVLDEEPGQIEAALLLAEILERAGSREELVALLVRQIDAAKDRGDATCIASLALRLGSLVESSDRDGARSVYYTGLDWEPNDKGLLDALLRLLESEDNAAERADVLERRLALEQGPEAESMAMALWRARSDAGDESAAERALVLGYAAHPESEVLPGRLEDTYRRRGDWGRLAELFVGEARARQDIVARTARLRDAADIWFNQLNDPKSAADALGLARKAAPNDVPLILDHVKMLLHARDFDSALSELSGVLGSLSDDDVRRSPLLASRAGVKAALGDQTGQLEDLEAAFSIEPETHAAALAAELDRARARAATIDDEAGVRNARLRLAQVLPFAGDADGARAALEALLKNDPRDREAWRVRATLESALERWDAASEAWSKLLALEGGTAAVDAALSFAEACERAGRPAEARNALEQALLADRTHRAVRDRLEQVYEVTGAWHELARLATDDARATNDPEERFGHLLRAGWLLLTSANDATGSVAPLEEAVGLRPADLDGIALLSDAYIAAGRAADAAARLEEVVAPHRGRRARELAPLHVRLARAAHELGNSDAEALSLVHALECDAQNGDVCAEVAVRAFELGQLDLATRALRAVTLLKTPGPMTKAVAYHYMGEIARQQGDPKRAIALLRRAISEDPTLEEARGLLDFIEQGQK